MLRERYPSPEYAFFEELRNGTGFSRSVTRSADAVAFSLWPSRGLELHGFECKTDRADWVRELKDPAKAEAISQFCDRWWVVVGSAELVRAGELPPTWGLLAPKQRGGVAKLAVIKEAPKLEAKQLDRPMLASLFRNLHDAQESAFARRFEAEVEQRLKDAPKHGAERELEQLRKQHGQLVASVREFETKSGLSLTFGYHGPNLAGLVHLLTGPNWKNGTLASLRKAADDCAKQYIDAAENAGRIRAEVDALLREIEGQAAKLTTEAA